MILTLMLFGTHLVSSSPKDGAIVSSAVDSVVHSHELGQTNNLADAKQVSKEVKVTIVPFQAPSNPNAPHMHIFSTAVYRVRGFAPNMRGEVFFLVFFCALSVRFL
jgi:hypothetical protein